MQRKCQNIKSSAIGLHFLQNKDWANNYNDQQFSILCKARSTFHLSALEAIYIKTQIYFISPERIRLLIAYFTLVGVHPTLAIFHLYSYLFSPAASSNQRLPLVN